MATPQQIATEITAWSNSNASENFPNFYTAWEFFKVKLNEAHLEGQVIELPSGLVLQTERFVADGSKQDEDIYYTVVFSIKDETFKVQGFYDSWNGEPWDLPVVEKFPYHRINWNRLMQVDN